MQRTANRNHETHVIRKMFFVCPWLQDTDIGVRSAYVVQQDALPAWAFVDVFAIGAHLVPATTIVSLCAVGG